MDDICVAAPDGARSLARIGAVLGEAGISLEGGGMWSYQAHYLVADGARAQSVLDAAGLGQVVVRPAVVVPLRADVPGELGRIMGVLDEAGVTLLAQYSDHDNRKVLVVADPERAGRALG